MTDEFPIQRLDCRICGKSSSMAYEYKYMGGIAVCSDCASTIANVFSMKHGGRYLTWPNDSAETQHGYGKKDIPEGLRWQVFERDDFRCKRCGSRRHLRADHIHPESAGGEATLDNLQTLCRSCNSKKGKRVEPPA